MLHFLHNLPYAWLFTAVVIGFIGHAIYAHDLWPIPGDAALVVLAHTGWFGLFVAVALFCARRWPAWCDDVAQAWPHLAMRTLLPGMATHTPAKRASVPVTGSTHRLSVKEWMAYVNDQPQRVPHLVVVGASGDGKTTTATALLDQREGEIVILSGKEGDAWGGLPYIGIDDDLTYTTVQRTFTALHQELKRRQLAVKYGDDPGGYLTITLDDFSTLQKVCKEAIEIVKIVWRIGRTLRVRLVMLTDSTQVEAIGLAGEGEARTNACYIELSPRTTADMYRLDRAGKPAARQPIDVRGLDKMAARAVLAGRGWEVPAPSSAGRQTQPLATVVAQPAPHNGKRPISDAELSKFKRSKVFTRQDVHDMGYEFRDERWTAA